MWRFVFLIVVIFIMTIVLLVVIDDMTDWEVWEFLKKWITKNLYDKKE